MGVFEAAVVLQTVASHPVKADVPEPNETNGEGEVMVPTVQNKQRRKEVTVAEVVEKRADLRVAKVTNHEQVGGKKQHRKNPPVMLRD